MIVVADTNVLVSALLFPGSVPHNCLQRIYDGHTLLRSPETLLELRDVITRKKFDRYFSLDERVRFVIDVERNSTLVMPADSIAACRDPKDETFLSLAVAGHADVIVTGDDDLLALNPFRGVAIVTPQQFLDSHGPT